MEKQIKAVLRGNPSGHRQKHPVYGMTPNHHTITHTDKEATKIRANHQPDWQWHPVKTTDQDRKIPMQWMLIKHRSVDLLLNATNVRRWGI